MRVGVIDAGSTPCACSSHPLPDTVRTLREERVHLGEEILHYDRVRRRKLDEVREVTGEYARIARKLGVRELKPSSPHRGARAIPERLIDAIHQATGASSGRDQGRCCAPRANPGEGVIAVRRRRVADRGRRRHRAARLAWGAPSRSRFACA